MTTQIAKSDLLDAVQRLSGTPVAEGQVGMLIAEDKRVVLAGILADDAPVDAWALSSCVPLSANNVALVGVGAGGRQRAAEWVDALSQAQTGLSVSRAVVVEGGTWSDVRGSGAGVVGPERQDIIDLNPNGVRERSAIYERLTPMNESLRVPAATQRKMSRFISDAMAGTSSLERTEHVRMLAGALAGSVDPGRDAGTVATITELMRDPSVQAGVTAHAAMDKEVSDGLVRAARVAVLDKVASPVWVAAATGVWAHGRDEVGPVPTDVLAAVVEPHVRISPAAASLHARLVSGGNPEPARTAAHQTLRGMGARTPARTEVSGASISAPTQHGPSWEM